MDIDVKDIELLMNIKKNDDIDVKGKELKLETAKNYPVKILKVTTGKTDECILNDCARGEDVKGEKYKTRKIVIVEYEAVDIKSYNKETKKISLGIKNITMYYSSGSNSYENIQKYFSKITIAKDFCKLWLPASGLGRVGRNNYKGNIKILK